MLNKSQLLLFSKEAEGREIALCDEQGHGGWGLVALRTGYVLAPAMGLLISFSAQVCREGIIISVVKMNRLRLREILQTCPRSHSY